METKNPPKKSANVKAILLACIVCAVASAVAASNAGFLSFTVSNSVPKVSGVACIQEGLLVSCKAVLTDLNGYFDLLDCNGTLSSGDVEYGNAGCIYAGSGIEATCVCSFRLEGTETGRWNAVITARDYDSSGAGEGTVDINFYDMGWLAFRPDSWGLQTLAGLLGFD